MLGVSASVRPLRLLEVEAGASIYVFFPHYYARLGGVLPRVDTTRFDLELIGQVGYRKFRDVSEQGPDAVLGLDFCWWASRYFGLTGQVVGGAFYDLDDRETMLEIRLSIGVAIAIGGSQPDTPRPAMSGAEPASGS
ncbi:MAG: hypothetical protein ACOX6T_05990 [Myxococcales bacterium]|jgi:hypothetical protein